MFVSLGSPHPRGSPDLLHPTPHCQSDLPSVYLGSVAAFPPSLQWLPFVYRLKDKPLGEAWRLQAPPCHLLSLSLSLSLVLVLLSNANTQGHPNVYCPLLSLLLLALSPSLSKSSYLKSFLLQDGLLGSSSHVEGRPQPSACLLSGDHPRAATLCACSALPPSLPLDCGLPEHKPGSPRCPPGQAEPRYKVEACFPTPSPNNPPSLLLEGEAGDCRVFTASSSIFLLPAHPEG